MCCLLVTSSAGSERCSRFHDRSGLPCKRRLTHKKTIYRIGSPDVTVGQLDSPVPSTIAHYPLLPAGYDYRLLNGAKFLITDKERRVHVFRVNRINQTGYEEIGGRKGFGDRIHANWHKRLVAGDSGHPAFVIVNGQLVLVSTLKGGGWASHGPFFGGNTLQRAIIKAIDQLNGHQAGSDPTSADEKLRAHEPSLSARPIPHRRPTPSKSGVSGHRSAVISPSTAALPPF